jgi:hypothetical protein
MSNSLTLNIKKQLNDDIKLYCQANNIENIELFCIEMLEKGFMVEKYGNSPGFVKMVEKNLDKKPEEVSREPEKPVSLPEPPKTDEIKKGFKKATLNDDYTVYDNF